MLPRHHPLATKVVRKAAILLSATVLAGGGSCAYHHGREDPKELAGEERRALDSMALTIVSELRTGDTTGARKLAVDGQVLNDLLNEDSALVRSSAVMRPSYEKPGYRNGDRAELSYTFSSAPESSRCPQHATDTFRTFIFSKRGSGWVVERIIRPFC